MSRPRQRFPATPDDFKALSNPLRLQILRLCLHEPRTNAELSARLGRDPSTVLAHVRLLVRTGFLEPEAPRNGPRGPLVKPYRATRRSWSLNVDQAPRAAIHDQKLAMIDAFTQEATAAGESGLGDVIRLGVRLNETDRDELTKKIWDILHHYADRADDPDGTDVGLLWAWHRAAAPKGNSNAAIDEAGADG